ncbi:hypothetical protein WR25_13809 [Diploscapter pachys]|uniref:CCHC-type domain-containing protein n=1 Tax=Diploscapter pachys TaxID=2018661 RepID=A0A2A2J2T0_9BILA|nr:hypothetical protein WR25_13809 [Diploscapter pachys]
MARIYSNKRSVTKVNDDARSFLSTTEAEVEHLSRLTLGKKDSEYNQAELSAALITQRGKILLNYGEPLAPIFYDEIIGKYANEDDEDCQEHSKLVLDMVELLSEIQSVLHAMDRVCIICDRGKKENKEKRSNTQPVVATAAPVCVTVKQPSPIPSFTGKIEDWPLYWSIFDANINQDATLTKCEKMQRLLVGLHGGAQHVVQGLLVNDDNYQKAIDWLKAKYENSTEVNKTLTEKLLSEAPKSNRMEDQRIFLGTIKSTIAQLQVNGAEPHPAVITCSIIPKFSSQVQLCLADRLADEPEVEKDLTSLLRMLTVAVDSAERRSKVANAQKQVPFQKEDTRVNTVIKQPRSTPSKTAKPHEQKCVYCGGSHRSWECTVVADVSARAAILQKEGRCFRCTSANHQISSCRGRPCFYCRSPTHNSSICSSQPKSKATNVNSGNEVGKTKSSHQQRDNKSKPKFNSGTSQRSTAQMTNTVATQQKETVITDNVVSNGSAKVLLPIAQAITFDATSDKTREVHLLLDSGSDTTFITRSLARQLRLKSIGKETRTVKPFNTEPTTKVYQIYEIILTDKRGKPHIIQAIETEAITGKVPNIALTEEDRQFLKAEQISLSVSENYACTDPQILIGSDIFDTFVSTQETKKALPQGTALMKTSFGFIPYGPAQIQGVNWTEELSVINTIKTHAVNTQQIPDFTPDNQEFTGPTAEEKRQISEQVWKDLEETIQEERQTDGTIRYAVKLPWIPTQERLPTNRAIAKRRLENLYKSSKAIEGRLEQIDKYFKEQLELGILEVVNEKKPASGSRVHYLPNMPVLRPENKTHPLRMVMDASAHYTNEPCLNDLLYPGPLLLPNLAGNLLRFRTGKFALIADIEKAFLQVRLQSCDRDASRTLWVKDLSKPPTENNILVLRHTTVLFGLNCAPFLLAATIVHHAKHSNQLSEELRRELLSNTYVDNVLCCAETQEEILRKYHELCSPAPCSECRQGLHPKFLCPNLAPCQPLKRRQPSASTGAPIKRTRPTDRK